MTGWTCRAIASAAAARPGPAQRPAGRAVSGPDPAPTLGRFVTAGEAPPAGRAWITVEQATLATLAGRERLPRIHLLKLDVEGAGPALDRVERVVLEIHGAAVGEEVDRRLRPAGLGPVLRLPPAYAYYLCEGVPG